MEGRGCEREIYTARVVGQERDISGAGGRGWEREMFTARGAGQEREMSKAWGTGRERDITKKRVWITQIQNLESEFGGFSREHLPTQEDRSKHVENSDSEFGK